jgi:predicted phage-related endonuclease
MQDDHFKPEVRATGWYATDTRRAVSGQLIDVILEKRGEKERPDLSEVEAVRMGLVMQPTIASIFTETTGIETRPLDIAGTHRTQEWLRSHFDFLAEDGGLVEVKNYNAAVINKYSEQDEEPVRIPPADYWQCLHEAVVYDAPHVYFAVLFGGQRFRYWKLHFDQFERDLLVKRTAQWWGLFQSGGMPTPETVDQAKAVYQTDNAGTIIANGHLEEVAAELKLVKQRIKQLEQVEDQYQTKLMAAMGSASELVAVDGSIIATWKAAKASKKFDAKAFESELPDTYSRYIKDVPGSRRFLLK